MNDNISYNPKIKAEFILECAKIGKVHVTSNQIIIETDDGPLKLRPLKLPDGCSIDWVNAYPSQRYTSKATASLCLVFE